MKNDTLLSRFNCKYRVSDNGCWIWTASLRNGRYAQMWDGSTVDYAHRISFRIFHGPIPVGHVVCHRCDTQNCVNPEHLFNAEQVDNIADCMRKGRMHSAYDSDIKILIKDLLISGMSQSDVARNLKVPRTTVRYWGVEGVRRDKAIHRI